MKKLTVCLSVYLIIAFSYKVVMAGEPVSSGKEMKVADHVHAAYENIDFSNTEVLSYDAFASAYKGYLNLKDAGKLSADRQVLTVCDFNLPSTAKRMWIIDLAAGKVLFNTYVAHGQGSGDDYAVAFSNRGNSHQSSLGFYVTGDTYNGEHGLSLRLSGVDQGFNDAAMERGIVVHGADYVSDKFIAGNVRLGRSWGCPAVPDQLKVPIIKAIQGGTCLFIYHTDATYSKNAYWLNKKIDQLPETPYFGSVAQLQKQARQIKYQIQYTHDGKVDSVKNIYAD